MRCSNWMIMSGDLWTSFRLNLEMYSKYSHCRRTRFADDDDDALHAVALPRGIFISGRRP